MKSVIRIDPNLAAAAAHNNRGAELAGLHRHEEAVGEYRLALSLQPGSADVHTNLGVSLAALSRHEEAGEAYRQALRIDPKLPAALNNMGTWLLTNGQVDEAIACFREARRLKPDAVDAICNLGIALLEIGKVQEAAQAYDDAFKIDPNYNEAHWCLACLALLIGDHRRGWIEYEYRWRTRSCKAPRVNYPRPNWVGENLRGKTILLYTEQGLGDAMQFIRYAPLVHQRGGRVILHCHRELGRLFHGVAGIEQIVVTGELPPFDLYCPLMSLPLIFGTRVNTIPADVPYIKPDTELAQTWRNKLNASPGQLKVGLVWAGGAEYMNDRKRSINLAQLAPLARVPNVTFYSLQKGGAAEQAKQPPAGMKLIDLAEELTDFAETAAAIANLDLVISVDTAVAHLAGAMGRPVWVLLPTNPDWRWMLERVDSPWYPTARLFRQTVPGQWSDVAERLAATLAGLRQVTNDAADPKQMTLDDAMALARQHHQAGRYKEAGAIYWQILAQHPNNTEALHLMGQAARDAGKLTTAMQCFRRAIAIDPAVPDFHNSLALVLAAGGQLDKAIATYREVIRLQPDFPDAYYNLGNALLKSRRFDEAIEAYRQATGLRPEHCDAHINLGDTLAQNREFESAIDAFRRALEIEPNHALAHMNLGLALMELRQWDDAVIAARRAIELDPESGDTHWLMASLSLLRGDFETGWAEYEWRWRGKNAVIPRAAFAQPRWNGEELHGKTILLHAEQGLGDTLHFIRYAPLVAQRGGRVIVECRTELAPLVQQVAGVEQVYTSDPLPAFDVQCPMMSLPYAFKTRKDTIPANIPYINANPILTETWANKTAGIATGRRVGLVWAGGPAYKNDRARSISLSQFAALAHVKDVTFFSLQKGPAAEQASSPPEGMQLIDLTADLTDFADTAALIANLDLVISVDTAVAHLAGAMGKPVWLMLPYNCDWRWMIDPTDSPWYPTMRLFRQAARGDWAGVMQRITGELSRE